MFSPLSPYQCISIPTSHHMYNNPKAVCVAFY